MFFGFLRLQKSSKSKEERPGKTKTSSSSKPQENGKPPRDKSIDAKKVWKYNIFSLNKPKWVDVEVVCRILWSFLKKKLQSVKSLFFCYY